MKSRASAKGNIYFMRRADGVGAIKIGCSKWPAMRLRAMTQWSPEQLEVVATVPGTFADERRLHRQFNEFRLHGEWFEAAPAVLAAMSRAATLGELPPAPVNDRTVRIMASFDSGTTLQNIANEHGITRQRVEQIVRKNGGKRRGQGSRKRAPVWGKIEEVRSLAKSGCTLDEIADAIGDARHNVYAAIRENNIEFRKAKKKVSDRIAKRAFDVAAEYKAGTKTAEIAGKFGIPQPNIYRLLQIAGVKPARVSRSVFDLPISEIAEAYRNGATLLDLSARHDRTTQTIRARLVKAGVRLRTREENEAIRTARVSAANKRRAA